MPKETGKELKPLTGTQTKLVASQSTGTAGNVHCGLQDKAGDIWFGTTGDGVYRYNGKSFTNFTTKHGLSSNIIYSLLEDKAGNIWIGTDNGICRYDGKTVSLVPIAASRGSYFNAINAKYDPSMKKKHLEYYAG